MDLKKNEELKKETEHVMYKTIKGVGEDIEKFKFNTATSKLMTGFSQLSKSLKQEEADLEELIEKKEELFKGNEYHNDIVSSIAFNMLHSLKKNNEKTENINVEEIAFYVQGAIASWEALKEKKYPWDSK